MNKIIITKDTATKKIKIERAFDAPRELVWKAWTKSDLLDQWWAPEPWKAETKTLEFKEGGHWLYSMNGPEGERHWARVDFKRIESYKHFQAVDSFCDEQGNPNHELPVMNWTTHFNETESGTNVLVEISFETESDLRTIVKMGFEEGFTSALNNLDRYLNTQFKLRKQSKTNNMARVTTYLNFPGKTEEAFNFYKDVFNGEFTGVGLRRFGDIELPDEHPPMSEEEKKLIIHAELIIMAGHVLMATDSPESMGFTLEQGNNMHINLEPDSREEAKRLFDALSEEGDITMPLQDMFWGAYFGTCTDRYGVNWMINYQPSR